MRYRLERIPHSIVFATTLSQLYENHKINFDGKRAGSGETRHTSLDWFLIPKERPSIDKAEVKEHYIDIPGTNGGLDLTESLTGFPLYNYIEGSFEFTVLNDRKLPILDNKGNLVSEKDISWEFLNRDIRAFLNGKERYMMLEDDPSWYYVGRFTVGKYDSSESANSKIIISYKVYPFKRLSVHPDSLESFFDVQPLRVDDTNKMLISFWDKKGLKIKPGKTVSFIREELPCGNDSAQLIFITKKTTEAYKLYAELKTLGVSDDDVIRDIKVEVEVKGETDPDNKLENRVKIRGFVLTNSGLNGGLYSDNNLILSVEYPNDFSPQNEYSKDDIVSYISTQTNIKWILKAKEDITAGSESDTIDLTKWEVDTKAMNVSLMDDTKEYNLGDLAYEINDNKLTLLKVYHKDNVSTLWTDDIDVDADNVYGYIAVEIKYDIGVM